MQPNRKYLKTSGTLSHSTLGGGGFVTTGGTVTVAYPTINGVKALYGVFVWAWKQPTGGGSGTHVNTVGLANYNPNTLAVTSMFFYGSSTFFSAGAQATNPGGGATGIPVDTSTTAVASGSGATFQAFSALPLCAIDNFKAPAIATSGYDQKRGIAFYVNDGDQVKFGMATNSGGGGGPGAAYYYDLYYFF